MSSGGLDPRIRLLGAVALGAGLWRTGWAGVGLALAALALVHVHFSVQRVERPFGPFALFVLVFTGLKFGFGIWEGMAWPAALNAAGLLGARLATLFGLGLVLAATTSTRALGMAIGKLFRPVLGRNAWQVALALALMVHYLPLAWSTLSTIRSSIALRCPDLGWRRRVLLLPQAGIRTLAQTTWSQTLAVAARGLDGPEAWDHPMPLSWRDAAGAAVMLAFAGLIAWL